MRKVLNVAIVGSQGRMGQELIKVISTDKGTKVCATIDKAGRETFKNLIEFSPDVVIDFSSPKGAIEASRWCAKNKTPLVTGTTGLTRAQEKYIKTQSSKTAILKSANMSVGVNALIDSIKTFAQRFGPCEVEIEEIHHRHKKDKPSGTAKLFEEALRSQDLRGTKVNRPLSLRGGGVLGVHRVYFFSDSEWVCFEHHATDRALFAQGALGAAKRIVGKKPGLYSLSQI